MPSKKAEAAEEKAGASAPAAVFVSEVKPDRRVRPVDVEIAAREKIIEEAKRQITALQNPFQEFPKMVKGLVVENAEQEKAVLAGTAEIEEVQTAEGVKRTVK